ncbi:MAG: extracellular native short-chain-length polyhydroxyalkanoate depolymerase PhaZ7 [Burkholderiaceae bacterium]
MSDVIKKYKQHLSFPSFIASALGMVFAAIGSLAPVAVVGVTGLAYSNNAAAVTCGTFDGKVCSGTASQFAGGFVPNAGQYGGFGGASSCTVTHTPVIFVHGNGDNATSWDAPTFQVSGYSKAPNSVYQQFKAAGYKDCELFGVTYLSSSERSSPQYNTHTESKYDIIEKFIRAVKAYTGKSQVDIVSHSLGVTMSMTALTYYGDWGSVRRFVNIAGGIHGLDSCLYTGYANPYATTCDSQNWYDSYWFGFFPDSWSPGINPWTGTSASYAFANSGVQHTATSFYTIYAGTHDEIHCTTVSDYSNCGKGPLLKTATSVKAQLNVGAGSNSQQIDWSWSDYSMFNLMGGDTDGVGHFHAKTNTGQIIVNMLNTTCTGTGCAAGYTYGPVQ